MSSSNLADAASSFVAALLQQTFQAAAHAQGQRLTVIDLAPLPPSDSTGATAFSATLSLIIPGAAATAMRDVVYFEGYGATRALLTLGTYAVVGAIAAVAVNKFRPPATVATVATVADPG